MKKLNGFESYLVIEGLAAVRKKMTEDIERIEAEGKNSLMTAGYIEMIIDDTIEKIKALTLKQK